MSEIVKEIGSSPNVIKKDLLQFNITDEDITKRKNTKTCQIKKSVSQYSLDGNFIQSYESAREASRQIGTNPVSIEYCCNNKQKTANGFIWKFTDKSN